MKAKKARGKPFQAGNTTGQATQFQAGPKILDPQKLLEDDLRKGLVTEVSWWESFEELSRRLIGSEPLKRETRDLLQSLLLVCLQKAYCTGPTRNRVRRLWEQWNRTPNYKTPQPKPVAAPTPAPAPAPEAKPYRIPTDQERAEQQREAEQKIFEASAFLTREMLGTYREAVRQGKDIIYQTPDGRFTHKGDEIALSTVNFTTAAGSAVLIWLNSPGRNQVLEENSTTAVWKTVTPKKTDAPLVESPAHMMGVSETRYKELHRELNQPLEHKILPHQIPNQRTDSFSAGVSVKPYGTTNKQKNKRPNYETSQTGLPATYETASPKWTEEI